MYLILRLTKKKTINKQIIVLLNVQLLKGAREGDVSEVMEAIRKGADIETRKPLMLTESHGF